MPKILAKFHWDRTSGAPNTCGVEKMCDFWFTISWKLHKIDAYFLWKRLGSCMCMCCYQMMTLLMTFSDPNHFQITPFLHSASSFISLNGWVVKFCVPECMSSVNLAMTSYPLLGMVRVTWFVFEFLGLSYIFGVGEARDFKCGAPIDTAKFQLYFWNWRMSEGHRQLCIL